MKHPLMVAVVAAILLAPSAFSQTFSIDFQTNDQNQALVAGSVNLAANEPYRNFFGSGVGVRLSTDAPSSEPLNLYDTEGTNGADDDLERNSTGTGLYAGGSNPGLNYGNVLIINTDNNISTPNDEANGGKIGLHFDVSLSEFGFDFIDMDTSAGSSVTFTDTIGGSGSTIVTFAQFEDGAGGVFERSNVSFGNRHANRILNVTAADLGLTSFDEITFSLNSSGGIGTIYGTAIPEPNSAAMLLGGLATLALFRRR